MPLANEYWPEDDKNEAKERVAINDQAHSSHISRTAEMETQGQNMTATN